MKKFTVAFLITALFCSPSFAQTKFGAVCIAPISKDMDETRGSPGLICRSNGFSLRIDAHAPVSWPTKNSLKIDNLVLDAPHRVVVYCDGKQHQSFTFRFSDYKSTELCLFLNDLYKTVQLWDPKLQPSPWCKCE